MIYAFFSKNELLLVWEKVEKYEDNCVLNYFALCMAGCVLHGG